ncbi:MAM and LDL-receptor class A domain-containing protein 1 isoform X2 [Nasonia vitripennis]|uniref:MAM domain-containing protein n=1 Tax=Nasonia vitripennis TaxID=7425 RepID=A0A7M7QKP9_NASVI|nr:MAM and LDL-receptor class A domain-containing protein 1 isoform X2 [Nasonia vitripennis]
MTGPSSYPRLVFTCILGVYTLLALSDHTGCSCSRTSASELFINKSSKNRNIIRRQVSRAAPVQVPTATTDEVFCDFGPLPVQTLCEWQDGAGALKWMPGAGLTSNWLGGPAVDSSMNTMEGGYAFIECSQVPRANQAVSSPNGRLHSLQLGSTGVSGTCFMFRYAIDGLSSAGLRVLLHPGYDEYSLSVAKALNKSTAAASDADAPLPPPPVVSTTSPSPTSSSSSASANVPPQDNVNQVLWHAHYHVLGEWQLAQILYTYPEVHTLIIEGMPVEASDPLRSYRGYIAVDDIDLQPGTTCNGFCNFAAGFCDWSNEVEDDFDWSISRGSSKPTTGPVMDREAASSSIRGGGYAYIDSSFPRRPGDLARLVSVGLPANNQDSPLCLHFAFHMFGSGIGELRISIRHARSLEAQMQEIWRLRGNAGNSWFDSRVTVSSLDDYQLVLEATVGNTAMGDIAVDDISFSAGPCPTSPQVAAPAHFPRDCSFEIDECGWISSGQGSSDWERLSQQSLSPRNQRKPYSLPASRPRQEFLMALQSRGGTGGSSAASSTSAYLISNEIKSVPNDPLCLSFWYLMFESFIDATGPSLGVLRVLVQPVGESIDSAIPIWQLYNNQGPSWNYAQANVIEKMGRFNVVFEGSWGPNRASGNIAIDDIAFYTGNCTVRPSSAIVRVQDCSFEKGLCGWENVSSSGAVNDPRMQWQRAYPNHRPAQLLDKTFGSPGDFVFFDIFSPNQKRQVSLRSPLVTLAPDEEAICFTFWFVAFGVEESTSLRILKISANQEPANESPESSQENQDSEQQVLWSITAKGFNNPRPSWTWAQVTVESRSSFRLILEGSASNGGFAIDDIKFQSQACPTRPTAARLSSASQEL